jgi:23S rRNA pseudouridine2605 synthase
VSDLNLQDNKFNSTNNSSQKNNSSDEMRLQLYLAKCGVASRRASEKIITDGRVCVNGEKITQLGTKVLPTDEVTVDGKKISFEENLRYVLLFKPAGYVCSLADEKGRQVAADLLKPHFTERLYNVGRLDMFSCGLILFTNDGDFAAKISHPSAQIEKEYIVDTSIPIPSDLAEKFKKGLRVDGVFYKAKDAEQINARRMRVVLIEGKNREIRRVFDKFEIGIKALTRIRIGNIKIEGLQSGNFRELTSTDVKNLLSLCENCE